MKFTPASIARCTIRTQSSWSGLPILPNIIAPRQYSLTRTPVLPRLCIFMLGILRRRCEVLVLGHELARRERRALRIGDDCRPDPWCVERWDKHIAPEPR